MRRILLSPRCAPALCALALVASWQAGNANAAVVGGDVTGGTSPGDFLLLPSPPPAAGPDAFDSPDLIAFDEQQDVLLQNEINFDPGITLPAGSIVSSHYVVFDPLMGSSVFGFVDFDEPILAVIGSPGLLDASAGLFGAAGTVYSISGAIGPDPMGADSAMVAPGDPARLMVNFRAVSPGDHVRVLTGVVPEPTAAVLLSLAVGGLATAGFRDRGE